MAKTKLSPTQRKVLVAMANGQTLTPERSGYNLGGLRVHWQTVESLYRHRLILWASGPRENVISPAGRRALEDD